MKNNDKRNRRLNGSITKRVIDLHNKGYHFDFLMLEDRILVCAQNNERLPAHAVQIQVVDQGYDQLTQSFKYIHTIDTGNGDLGVLLMDRIFTNGQVA